MRLPRRGKAMGDLKGTGDVRKNLLDQIPAIRRQILGHDEARRDPASPSIR